MPHAQPQRLSGPTAPSGQYLTFTLAGELYAVEIQAVTLQAQLAVVQHDQCRAALPGQVGVHVQRQLQRRPRRQGGWRIAGRDVMPFGQQRDAVQGTERRVAA